MTSNIIDQLLADFRPKGGDLAPGISRGQDFEAISDAEDTGLLDELAPGEHNNANSGSRAGLVAAAEDWHDQAAKPFTREDSIMGDILKDANGEHIPAPGLPQLTDADLKKRISAALHLGKTPAQVTAALNKLAEQALFNRAVSDEFLKDQAGLEGFAYIEPNHFMQSCKASLAHIKAHGKLRAASVKRIAACEGCQECKKGPDGDCKCAAYGLPIVANAKDLQRVLTAKLRGGNVKKASLVQAHNGEQVDPRPGHSVNVVSQDRSSIPTKTAGLHEAPGSSLQVFDAQEFRNAHAPLNPKAIRASLDGGKTLTQVYAAAKQAHGSAVAKQAVTAFLNSLKNSSARINLASIDCEILKHRLASTETILGTEKCASCAIRSGMHCGRTGGTLLSFPGMEAMNAKKASSPQGKDGVTIMAELELRAPELVIPISQDRNLPEVELDSIPTTRW